MASDGWEFHSGWEMVASVVFQVERDAILDFTWTRENVWDANCPAELVKVSAGVPATTASVNADTNAGGLTGGHGAEIQVGTILDTIPNGQGHSTSHRQKTSVKVDAGDQIILREISGTGSCGAHIYSIAENTDTVCKAADSNGGSTTNPALPVCHTSIAKVDYEKTAGQNCQALNLEDIMDLDECVHARDVLGFAKHEVNSAYPGTSIEGPRGCSVRNDGLVGLYPAGTQACTGSGMSFCLCKKPTVLTQTDTCDTTHWNDLTNVVVTSSSQRSEYGIDNIKSETAKPWHSKCNTYPSCSYPPENEWISFEFPQAVSLKGFKVKAPEGYDGSSFKDYRFEYSSSGGGWIGFHLGQGGNLDCCDWQTLSFETGSPFSKKFRLFMVNEWGYGHLVINQLQLKVCGSPVTSPALGTCKVEWATNAVLTPPMVTPMGTPVVSPISISGCSASSEYSSTS
jgi:hypothetical protein